MKNRVGTEEEINGLLETDSLVGALKRGMPVMPMSIESEVEDLVGW